MNPSDLAWWAWVIIGIIAAAISFKILAQESEFNVVAILGFLLGAGAAGCLLIGLILFVRWVWTS